MKKKILVVILSLAMILSFSSVAWATETGAADDNASVNILTLTKIQDAMASKVMSEHKANLVKTADKKFKAYDENETVRVSIILEDEPTIANYSTTNIANNSAAMNYRESLQKKQASLVKNIEGALGGKKLDVVWNLTLAANIISANMKYGDIAKVEAVDGVKSVIMERKYEPTVAERKKAEPNMATSGEMIGSSVAWADGYTGAGSRVAIIDTGIDDDHQSFDSGAFDYALAKNAETLGKTAEEYVAGLDLLDAEEISGLVRKLNVYECDQTVTAEDLFRNDKIAFGYNYVTKNLDITHEFDGAGEHGSHVAGIAAANSYVPEGEGYTNALEKVHVQGVAPDAQILVMKVFGSAADGSTYDDGAYDSDYMAAIEDAIILGADSINLSLGSAVPGLEKEYEYDYENILDSLVESDTVVSISAGNNASVGANSYYGQLYGLGVAYPDDNSFNTVGSPGSYTNSLTVASVDNTGKTGNYILSGEDIIFYNENIEKQEPLTSLAGDKEYSYVMLDGVGTAAQIEALGDQLEGKIAVVQRGAINFSSKCVYASEAGAIAIIIYNNQPGMLSMNLSGYEGSAPAVIISQEDGEILKANSENASEPNSVVYDYVDEDTGEVTKDQTLEYYSGTITIPAEVAVTQDTPEYYTMSDFSSMGTPTSLILKPEITAPGGNIYSVMGAHDVLDKEGVELTGIVGDSTTYENMSGTSMAAPQVSGMAALVAQYIRENGLDEQEGVSARVLAQSLLMATSVPATDSYGEYYSVMKQGSGIANVGNAVQAASYIIMNEDATASYADGKVKAELGDDPERTGAYSYGFTVHNMTDTDQTYTPSTDMFVQYPESGFMLDDTGSIGAEATYTVNGEAVEKITVPAKGSVEVKVDMAVAADELEFIDEYYVNGTYIEGYTFLTPEVNEEGAYLDVEYSIPILAYYGNYSDASMYDVGSMNEWYYGTMQDDGIVPYSYATFEEIFEEGDYLANNMYTQYVDPMDSEYVLEPNVQLSNPYMTEDENALDRQAITSTSVLVEYDTRNIDNASIYTNAIFDAEGNIVSIGELQHDIYPAFYYPEYGLWLEYGEEGLYYYGATFTEINKTPAELGFKEGDTFTAAAVAIPEYYTKGKTVKKSTVSEWLEDGTLGKGVLKGTTFTVDDTYPEAVSEDVEVKLTGETTRSISVDVQDNRYVAYAAILDANDYTVLAEMVPEQTEAGSVATCNFEFDLAEFEKDPLEVENYVLVVADYAGNENYYELGYEAEFPMSRAEVTASSVVYTGAAQTPEVTVAWEDGTAMVEGTDYVISYLDANGEEVAEMINAGTYYIAVKGIGKYADTQYVEWTINPVKIASATLKSKSLVYNGKNRTTAVTVKAKVAGKTVTLKKDTDYTVTYSNNKNVGKATAKIVGIGNFTGTLSKTYKIIPKATTLKTPAAASKALTVKWNKQATKMSQSRITGYEIQVATNSTFTKNKKTVKVNGYKKVSKKVTGLKGGKKYYVRVRTYMTVGDATYYSKWSAKKSAKTKK
ncbi:MAG: S8 family serine peptidase [Firmicutes bacterium]|nr:S8 family serine peptidase [Bacillota bacterium]